MVSADSMRCLALVMTDQAQPVVFGEVLEILQVQGCQWQVSDQAARRDPRVIDRAGRPRLSAWMLDRKSVV